MKNTRNIKVNDKRLINGGTVRKYEQTKKRKTEKIKGKYKILQMNNQGHDYVKKT